MKVSQKLNLRFLLLTILISCINCIVFANDGPDGELKGQEFLFMTEEAYLQEKGEWQVSFSSLYRDRKTTKEDDEINLEDMWQLSTEIEYGLSDWLQIEVEIPFLYIDKKTTEDSEVSHFDESGLGDIETGISIRLFEEDEDLWWAHTVSAGFGIAWPSGDWKKGFGTDRFGWEAGLSISKMLEQWAYHLSGGFGIVDEARERGESSRTDIHEFELGVALVYRPTEKLDLICESFAEYEQEKLTAVRTTKPNFTSYPASNTNSLKILKLASVLQLVLQAIAMTGGLSPNYNTNGNRKF